MSPHEHAMDLVQRYVDGLATAEETRELADLLREDTDLREYFLEYLNIDTGLEECAADAENVAPVAEASSRSITRRRWRGMLAFAAATVLVVLVATQDQLTPPRVERSLADALVSGEIIRADDVRWAGRVMPVIGSRVQLKQICFESGTLALRLNSGVVIDFTGPVDGTFESDMRLRLSRGRISADVGATAHGFTVATSAGEVIDLGTRFAMNVTANGQTQVAVFSGKVQFEGTATGTAKGAPLSLLEGEAVQLNKSETPQRMPTLFLNRDKALLEDRQPACAIVSISDNVTERDFRRFYGIVPHGLREGALAYTDNLKPCWRSRRGDPFPSELESADLIRPFQADRHTFDLQIKLELAAPSMVYIMHDIRKPPPDWIEKDFTDTGLRLRCGPWRPEGALVRGMVPDETGEFHFEYSVWRREIRSARTVELGPPHARGQGGPSAMYGIAVKPLQKNFTEDRDK